MQKFKLGVLETPTHPAQALEKVLAETIEDEGKRKEIQTAFGVEMLAGGEEVYFSVRRLTFHDRKELERLCTEERIERSEPNRPGKLKRELDEEKLTLMTIALAVVGEPPGYAIEPRWGEGVDFTPGKFDFRGNAQILEARVKSIKSRFSYEEAAWLGNEIFKLNVFNSGRIDELKKASCPGSCGTGADAESAGSG